VLLDHNVTRKLRACLPGHEVRTAREMAWERLRNGALLQAAADGGFDAFVTVDKNMEYERNLSRLALPVVVLNVPSNALPSLTPTLPALQQLLAAALDPALYVIEPSGQVLRIATSRPRTI
jgi:hypothetical protein